MKNTILTSFLLPTKDASEICKLIKNGELHLRGGKLFAEKNGTAPNQHIYLCSSLPIKEGDWVLTIDEIWKYTKDEVEQDVLSELDKKIEFTTDPKLIADGVPKIDGNTKAIAYSDNTKRGINDGYEVNFLEEYCKRYNQKDNQKEVDVEKLVEKLADDWAKKEGKRWYTKVSDGSTWSRTILSIFWGGFQANKSLQSNAGGFSLDDMRKLWNYMDERAVNFMDDESPQIGTFENYIDFTKEQPKGDIIIECEMEEVPDLQSYKEDAKTCDNVSVIKLTNGQPILIFK